MSDEEAAQGIRTAFDLFEFGLQMTRERFRRQHPGSTDADVEEMLLAWLVQRPGGEQGDCPGRLRHHLSDE